MVGMAGTGDPADRTDPDADRVARAAAELADVLEGALPGWVERSVQRVMVAWRGSEDPEVAARAVLAGAEARDALGPRLRTLLIADIDEQHTSPLAIVRDAVPYPTRVLEEAGVPPIVRDPEAERRFPADHYDLTPGSFAEVDPVAAEPGVAWGAAKAMAHRHRHAGSGIGNEADGADGAAGRELHGSPAPAGASGDRRGRLLALVPDLMDRSKVSAAATREVVFVRSADALVDQLSGASGHPSSVDLVVVDLARPGALGAIGELVARGCSVVAFGSHVDREVLAAAKEAGCEAVLPRSEFFSRLPELLA
jgi:hypothetical protein